MASKALAIVAAALTLVRLIGGPRHAMAEVWVPAPTISQPAAPRSADPLPLALQAPVPATFHSADRSVSTWRAEAAAHLDLTADAAEDMLAGRETAGVARCVKLNNYWCIKKAGWDGEIAADGEGHVGFASAVEGAAVAALLLKRYYVDFDRKTAMAIISRWAPAQCGATTGVRARAGLASAGLGATLRARWLAGHARGFVTPAKGAGTAAPRPRRSVVADRTPKSMPAPTIAVGLGERDRAVRPITLDALLMSSPGAPRSRSMLGMPSRPIMNPPSTSCAGDGARIARYAAAAASGIAMGADGDLALFDTDGAPTGNLATMMANMARVEIGPLAASPALIKAGIEAAFRPGRNPPAK